MTRLTRETNETRITAAIDLAGGPVDVTTDDDFLTHMVVTLARYGGFGLTLHAVGDLRHHLRGGGADRLRHELRRPDERHAELRRLQCPLRHRTAVHQWCLHLHDRLDAV